MTIFVREHWRYILMLEIFGVLLFGAMLWLRSYTGDIFDGEKFMEMVFYNGLSRVTSFPPYDPWMAGAGIFVNYYYLGYLALLLPAKLLGTDTAVAYNISFALMFTLSGLAGFGLIYNLTRSRWAGFVGWVILFLTGNLDTVRQMIAQHGLAKFDYFATSRVIPNTINEYPMFSLIFGDLHPHVMAIPVFIIQMGLGLEYFKQGYREIKNSKGGVFFLAVWGLVAGSLGVLNTWELPTAIIWALMVIFLKEFIQTRHAGVGLPWQALGRSVVWFLAFALIPYWPHYANFNSPTHGLGITFQSTTIPEYLVVFGWQLCLTLFFFWAVRHSVALAQPSLAEIFLEKKPFPSFPKISSRLVMSSGLLLVVLMGLNKSWLTGLLLTWMVFLVPLLFVRDVEPEKRLVLLMLLTGVGLSLGCEFVYIQDGYSHPPLERLNTVFKFYYEIWFLMGITGVYGGYWLLQQGARLHAGFRWFWIGTASVLVLAGLLYPMVSIPIRVKHFARPPTLDGLAFLQIDPGARAELEGIQWLKQHVVGNPVILEGYGNQFSFSARVSTFTGLPTILGWYDHEVIWRGQQIDLAQRVRDIEQIYSTHDDQKAQIIMDKYQVEYVFVGMLEFLAYPPEVLGKFGRFMDVVYHNPHVVIFQRRTKE